MAREELEGKPSLTCVEIRNTASNMETFGVDESAPAPLTRSMGGYVYIMANRRRGATYIGVTGDIIRRVYEHREKVIPGHTKRNNIGRLVYYEVHATMPLAIQREKNLKKWEPAWKYDLIENINPHWDDLWDEIVKSPF